MYTKHSNTKPRNRQVSEMDEPLSLYDEIRYFKKLNRKQQKEYLAQLEAKTMYYQGLAELQLLEWD